MQLSHSRHMCAGSNVHGTAWWVYSVSGAAVAVVALVALVAVLWSCNRWLSRRRVHLEKREYTDLSAVRAVPAVRRPIGACAVNEVRHDDPLWSQRSSEEAGGSAGVATGALQHSERAPQRSSQSGENNIRELDTVPLRRLQPRGPPNSTPRPCHRAQAWTTRWMTRSIGG
jgi:hypothetical protein